MTTIPSPETNLTASPATFPKRLRVLFYAVNGLGLGHLTRLLALCRALQKLQPEVDPLFITTSDADNLLSGYGIPYVHLPSKSVAALSGSFGYRKLARLYAALVNPVFDHFQPHVLVVDTLVTGALHDLLGVLRFGNCLKVYIHRARKPAAYDGGAVQAQRFYDLVIAPHYRDTELIPMPPEADVPLFWSGPVLLTDASEAGSRALLRQQWGLQEGELAVLIALGGGGDEANPDMLRKLLALLTEYRNLRLFFAQGPLATSLTLPPAVTILRAFPVAALLPGMDLAIASAGYNTFHELLHFGVPSLFIPRERGYDDQPYRAQRAAVAGAGLVVVEGENFEAAFRAQFATLLQADRRTQLSQQARQYVPQNHVAEAAGAILDLVRSRYPLAHDASASNA